MSGMIANMQSCLTLREKEYSHFIVAKNKSSFYVRGTIHSDRYVKGGIYFK